MNHECRIPAAAILGVFAARAALAIDAQEALASFELDARFQIELVASEPAVFDPVDLEFDDRGRPFVVEMPGYPFPGTPGRVVMLSDADADGVYETRTVFAEGFELADSVLPWRGGILVASPPELLYLKDTDGDNVSDTREVVMTGFAVDNPQHNFNGLTLGPDNWIYGANGGNSGSPYFPQKPDEKFPLRFQDFRIDIPNRRFERTGRSTGGFGITFDDAGGYYGTHNLVHISQLVFPGRYIEGLPIDREGSLTSISDHEENGTARIYPIGAQETRVNHPEQSGYFSGACGITYYGGGAFGAEFNGNVFVCDVVLNLVHRDVLSADGAANRASRADDKRDFLASRDRGFRPVNMSVGPDGALYVVDMHRDVIEHPEWIPDELEANLDLEAGKSMGRIYRISPKAGLARVTPQFDRADLTGVVAQLGHGNKWRRDTAQRLLVGWNDPASVPLVEALLRSSDDEWARTHALWTLEGMGALRDVLLRNAFEDPSAAVREHAIRIAEARFGAEDEYVGRVLELTGDSAARVRLQAALSLGTATDLDEPKLTGALIRGLEGHIDDPWVRLAVISAAQRNPLSVATEIMHDAALVDKNGAGDLVSTLAHVAGQYATAPELAGFLDALASQTGHDGLVVAALDGLAAGVDGRSNGLDDAKSRDDLANALAPLTEHASPVMTRATLAVAKALKLTPSQSQQARLAAAAAIVSDGTRLTRERLENVDLYQFAPFPERADLLFKLLDKRNPKDLQVAAIHQLEESRVEEARDPTVAPRLIAMWNQLGPDTRMPASDILLYQSANHDRLLTALEDGSIAIGQLNFDLERRRTLLFSRDDGIRKRAEALFTDAGVVTRKEALDKMRPALTLQGDAAKGHATFTELCAQCHVVGPEGVDLGPNLTEIFRKSPETLLHDIVDPNAAVDARFISFGVETLDGTFVTGIVADETDDAVTLREALGKETTIARSQIEDMSSSGLSLMPEELEVDMTPQKMADLLAFLQQPR